MQSSTPPHARQNPRQSMSYTSTSNASSSSPSRKPSSRSTSTEPSSSYFTTPVTYTFNSLLRRLSGDNSGPRRRSSSRGRGEAHSSQQQQKQAPTSDPMGGGGRNGFGSGGGGGKGNGYSNGNGGSGAVFSPYRTASPFQPPPLTPLSLTGHEDGVAEGARLLTRQMAEEIRLLVPPRLQLAERWSLAFSLVRDGVSLSTLYGRMEEYVGKRGGYVVVVKDGVGGIFGAYLSDPPRPNPHFYGTGECFLWRASILPSIPDLSSLPPPPSADTTNAQRQTTLLHPKSPTLPNGQPRSGASTPDRIRFKAFPYSGVNDYMIFCQAEFLSVGGGDGQYGLWLDDNLDKGVSGTCLTFGNEMLSDEGKKFDVLGVEVWYVGG